MTIRFDTDAAEALLAMRDRLHTAALTAACLPADGPKGPYTLWPRYKLTWWDPGNEDSKLSGADITRRLIAPPRFVPSPKEVDACLPTLALLEGLSPLHHKAIRLRAHQLWYGEHVAADDPDYAHWRGGWRAIGKMCGVSYETARSYHMDAVSHAFEKSRKLPIAKHNAGA